MDLYDAVAGTKHACAVIPGWNKLSTWNKEQLSTSVAMIISSVRTGYLVDAVSCWPDELALLVRKANDAMSLNLLICVYHDPTGQSFVINRARLLERVQQLKVQGSSNDVKNMHFIQLNSVDSAEVMPLPTSRLVDVIHDLASAVKVSSPDTGMIPLSENIGIDVLVPLAAFLLEYPVAYVPSTQHSVFLSQVPLDVHEVMLHFGSSTHSILKFSVPCHIAAGNPLLSPDALQQSLRDEYSRRVHRAYGESVSVSAMHSVKTQDRVAL